MQSRFGYVVSPVKNHKGSILKNVIVEGSVLKVLFHRRSCNFFSINHFYGLEELRFLTNLVDHKQKILILVLRSQCLTLAWLVLLVSNQVYETGHSFVVSSFFVSATHSCSVSHYRFSKQRRCLLKSLLTVFGMKAVKCRSLIEFCHISSSHGLIETITLLFCLIISRLNKVMARIALG